MKIYLYQYLARRDGKIIDNIISGWTKLWNWNTPPYSHSEWGTSSMAFSASTRGNGQLLTRFIPRDILLKNPERWDIYECEVTDSQYNSMLGRAITIAGKKYDWWGIFGFGFIFGWIQDIEKWYCSEACYYCIAKLIIRVSPRRLPRKLRERGFNFRLLTKEGKCQFLKVA